MTFEEKTISSERIYEGAIINLRRDEVTVQNGTSYREIIEHNGGGVLAARRNRRGENGHGAPVQKAGRQGDAGSPGR